MENSKLNWKKYEGDECPKCGCAPQVFTESDTDNWIFDGEEAKCPECELTGIVEADGETAYVIWDEEKEANNG